MLSQKHIGQHSQIRWIAIKISYRRYFCRIGCQGGTGQVWICSDQVDSRRWRLTGGSSKHHSWNRFTRTHQRTLHLPSQGGRNPAFGQWDCISRRFTNLIWGGHHKTSYHHKHCHNRSPCKWPCVSVHLIRHCDCEWRHPRILQVRVWHEWVSPPSPWLPLHLCIRESPSILRIDCSVLHIIIRSEICINSILNLQLARSLSFIFLNLS